MRRPPFDPELKAYYDLTTQNPPTPVDFSTIDLVRAECAAYSTPIELVIEGRDLEHLEFTVPGPQGAPDITLSIIRRPNANHTTACIYNIHGGGMIALNRFGGADEFPSWIEQFDVTVATVEYRLAPENPYPAQVDDCYAGLLWVAEYAWDLGIDPNRILLSGASAGGGLAAALALRARDQGGPALVGQVLRCPMLDDRNETVSSYQYDDVHSWNRAANLVGWTALLGESRGTAEVSPYAAPSRATDLGNLPPAFIDAGSAEVFRDEAAEYAARIWASGGQAELHIWSGAFHGFELAVHTNAARAAKAARYSWISRILGP